MTIIRKRETGKLTLFDLYKYADSQGIDVDYFPMREVESVSFPCGWIALDVDKLKNSADEKVHLAHEIGHLETGSFYNVYSPLDLRSRHETRADRWAIKKLIPQGELEKAVNGGIKDIWELAEYFGVPHDFMEKALYYYNN